MAEEDCVPIGVADVVIAERALVFGEGQLGERLVEILGGHRERSGREGEHEDVDGGEDAGEARHTDALQEAGRVVDEAPLGVVALAGLLAHGFDHEAEAGSEVVVGHLLCSERFDALALLDALRRTPVARLRTWTPRKSGGSGSTLLGGGGRRRCWPWQLKVSCGVGRRPTSPSRPQRCSRPGGPRGGRRPGGRANGPPPRRARSATDR